LFIVADRTAPKERDVVRQLLYAKDVGCTQELQRDQRGLSPDQNLLPGSKRPADAVAVTEPDKASRVGYKRRPNSWVILS
jgi:hypothetical protein